MQVVFDTLAELSRMDSGYEPYLEASAMDIKELLIPLVDGNTRRRIRDTIRHQRVSDLETEFCRATNIVNHHGPVGRRIVKKALWLTIMD